MKRSYSGIRSGVTAILFLSMLLQPVQAQEARIPVEPSEERLNRQHKPEELMDLMGLKEGMVIADIGAGRGRMTVFFADRVGEKGMVLANEINADALEYLENRCKRNGINNVRTYLGTVVDPRLPEGAADIVFMVSTYHHLEKPVQLLQHTLPVLKPGGNLIIVERDPGKTGQTSRESTSQTTLIKQVSDAGYIHVRTNTELLENDNVYFFSPDLKTN